MDIRPGLAEAAARAGLELEALEATAVRGCWRCKQTGAVLEYFDPSRDARGRFASPYQTWRRDRARRQLELPNIRDTQWVIVK